MLQHENSLWKSGIELIAGVDEAGRGPLAGPIVAAAVILNKSHLINDISNSIYSQIKDSKKLTSKKREFLFDFIKEVAIAFSIVEVSAREIDKIGISTANKRAFHKAIYSLNVAPDFVLTDYFPLPEFGADKQANITRGDNLSLSIAAASILAKVHRDNLMLSAHKDWPQYGFSHHKGYGTTFHRQMIERYGPCEIHRKSFTLLV